MPSRTRIIFVDPIDSLNAGRKVAHMGRQAVEKVLEMYRTHRGRYATVPPGSHVERTKWAWNQLLKEERAGAALYIIREKRGQDWRFSSARPENLGFYQANYKWARPKVQFVQYQPTTLDELVAQASLGTSSGAVAAQPASPKPAKKPKRKTIFDPEYGGLYADESPWHIKSKNDLKAEYAEEGPAQTGDVPMPNRQKKRKPAEPRKRLQIGVWA